MIKNLMRFGFPFLLSFVGAVVLTTSSLLIVSAFTGPPGSPPTGDGAMSVSGGNVGIGETTPDTRLHINSPEDPYIRIDRAGSTRVHLGDTGSGNDGMLQLYNASGVETTRIRTSGGDSWIGGGNVGIGTASPGTKLEVAGQVKIVDGTQGAGKVLTSDATGLATWADPSGGTVSGTGALNKLAYWTDTSTLSNDVSLHWNSTSNNLGIGTSNPSTALHVDGGSDSAGATANSGYVIVGPSAGTHISIDNNEVMAKSSGTAASTLHLNLDGGDIILGGGSGNVGIGTTVASEKLEVNGNIDMSGVSGRRIYMGGVSTGNFGLAYNAANPNFGIFYLEGSPDKVVLSPDGAGPTGSAFVVSGTNVGIGTTGPNSRLTIARDVNNRFVEFEQPGGASWYFTGDGEDLGLSRASSSDRIFYLDNSGAGSINVGIGTTTPGTYRLNVNGSTNITGDLNITGTCTGCSSGGITSLNGLTTSSQTFANDTNVTISSSISTHTIGWSGILAFSRGGTGSSTASGARINLGLATVSQVEAEAGTSTTTRAWTAQRVAQAIAAQAGSGTVSGTGTATQLAFWTGSSTLSSNSSLYWDNTNSRLGIGTTGPDAPIHANGGTAMTGAWNRTATLEGNYPVMAFKGNTGTRWGGIGYDATVAMRFWVNATTNDVSGTGNNAMTIANTGAVTIPGDLTVGSCTGCGTGNVSGTGSASRVAFWTGASTLSNDVSLFWNSTSNNLGVGVSSPSTSLHVDGGTNSSGGTANTGYAIIGPSAGTHLSIDNNEIMAKASGTTTSTLYINNDGGDVVFGAGAGKIDAGTVDPPYTIDGKKYATYLPAMTGVREETTGAVELGLVQGGDVYKYVIDFDEVSEGSDLWLFAQTVNANARDYFDKEENKWHSTTKKEIFDNMTVLLTPSFDGKVWYEKDAIQKRVIIFGTSDVQNTEKLEVSYRITAPRFDWKKWENNVSESEGFNLDKLLR